MLQNKSQKETTRRSGYHIAYPVMSYVRDLIRHTAEFQRDPVMARQGVGHQKLKYWGKSSGRQTCARNQCIVTSKTKSKSNPKCGEHIHGYHGKGWRLSNPPKKNNPNPYSLFKFSFVYLYIIFCCFC